VSEGVGSRRWSVRVIDSAHNEQLQGFSLLADDSNSSTPRLMGFAKRLLRTQRARKSVVKHIFPQSNLRCRDLRIVQPT
jgi:hypothetical protein